MTQELATTESRNSPESWRTYGTCCFNRRTVIEGDQNPYRITSQNREDAVSALREARGWLAGAPREKLLSALSELYLKTAKAGAGDEDFRARMQIYARDLADYPADVTLETIRHWRSTFFPTFAEIADAIERDWRIGERRTRVRALESFLAGKQDEKPKGPRVTSDYIVEMRRRYRTEETHHEPRVTPETLETIRKVDEQFGEKAKLNNGRWKPLAEIARKIASPT